MLHILYSDILEEAANAKTMTFELVLLHFKLLAGHSLFLLLIVIFTYSIILVSITWSRIW